MAKIDYKILKRNILNKKIEKLYYFIGSEIFFIKNFSNKILEVNSINCEDCINFISFDVETLDFAKLADAINIFPINSRKKCILLKGIIQNMNSDFFEKMLLLLDNIPDFCCIIIQDFLCNNNKKNIKYAEFISKISKISEFCEFKNEKAVCEKQAIIWAQKLKKTLSKENSKFLCKKAIYDMQIIKQLVENICISCRKSEISAMLIEKFTTNEAGQTSIFEVLKYLREKNLKSLFETINNLMSQNEGFMKIFAIICAEFTDSFRVKYALKNGKKSDLISFYKGKEFKIKMAEILNKNYNVEKCIGILLETDFLSKTANIYKYSLMNQTIINFCNSDDKIYKNY